MKNKILIILFAAFALAACDVSQTGALPAQIENPDEPTQYWSEITAEYSYTSQGNMQSPVDIKGPVIADMAPLEVKYSNIQLSLNNTGYAYEQEIPLNQQKKNSLIIDGVPYYLLEFHWHAPGEHKIKGKRAPAELHLVHRSSDDKYAVLGVMYEYGKSNTAVNSIFKAIGNPKQQEAVTINLRDLLPENLSYYFYQGSLTTPPYTEGFKWYVLQNPQYLSKTDMKEYKKADLKPNARKTKPINDRNVKKVIQ